MRKGDEDGEGQGGEVGLMAEEKNVDWETIWDRSLKGSDVPPALRGLRCVRLPLSLCHPFVKPYMVIVVSCQKTRRAYHHHSHRQCPPGSQ